MTKSIFSICLLMLATAGFAQRFHVGVTGGLAAYNGDLTEKIFPKKVTNGFLGITGNYELTDKIILRGGLTYAVVGGADRFSDDEFMRLRNLSFETSIFEFSALGEYNLFNLYEKRFTPYVFAGLAVYRYNPYAYNAGNKVFLQPLSTEGQNIIGYPDRKTYSLTQFAIPVGGGFKYAISENLRVGLELGLRKLFTDYLDDVSKGYVDPADLLAAKGQLAVDMAYRGDEVVGGNPAFPQKGEQRGGPEFKDMYYFSGLHLTYRLGNGNGAKAGRRNGTACPVNIY